MKHMDRPPLGSLTVPMYVIRMGWHRWGKQARRRWLRELIDACYETIHECEAEIARYDDDNHLRLLEENP